MLRFDDACVAVVFWVPLQTRAGFDPMVEDCKRAHVFGRHTACDVTTLKAVWPTVPRDMLHLVHWRRITEGSAAEGGGSGDAQTRSSVVVLNFSVAPNMPSMAGVPTAVNSKAIRADLKLGGWLIRPIDSGYSEVVYIAQCDLKSSSTKGALSSSVMKQMSQQHAFLAAALRRAVESKQINLGGKVPLAIINLSLAAPQLLLVLARLLGCVLWSAMV